MTTMFEERLDILLAKREARGEALGEARGFGLERALLSRLAGRKFGPDAASRLTVAGVDNPDRLEEVGGAAISCAGGAGVLARAGETAERR